MKIISVESIEQLYPYVDDWRALLDGVCESSTIFTTPDWAVNWWTYYGDDKELAVQLLFDGERLVGIAPFVVCESRMLGLPFRTLRFVGTRQSDHLDLYIDPAYRREGLSALFEHLANRVDWDTMDLVDLPEDSPNRPFIEELLRERGLVHSVQTAIKCPYLRIDKPDWNAFYAQKRSKSTRQDLRRRLRRLGELGEVAFRRYGDPAAIELVFPRLQTLYTKRWADKFVSVNFTSEKGRRFYLDMAIDFARRGRLDLLTLELNDRVIAFTLSIIQDRQFTWLLTAHDPELDKYFVGEQVIVRMLEDVFKRGDIQEFDFTRGDEPYKYKWASGDRNNVRILASNRRFQGKLLYLNLLGYHILRREAKKSQFLRKLKLDTMGQIKTLINRTQRGAARSKAHG